MGSSLFKIDDIGTGTAAEKLESKHSKTSTADMLVQINSKAKHLLTKIKDDLGHNTHVDFVTAGELSIHQFILYFATLFGKCNVYISSWAIKEEPARVLLSLVQDGTIQKLYGVFDYRIKTLDAKHFQLIEKAFSAYALTKNHSKVVIIESETLSLVIVSSANLSNNPRIECGFISTIDKTVQFHKEWMTEVLNGKTVY